MQKNQYVDMVNCGYNRQTAIERVKLYDTATKIKTSKQINATEVQKNLIQFIDDNRVLTQLV